MTPKTTVSIPMPINNLLHADGIKQVRYQPACLEDGAGQSGGIKPAGAGGAVANDQFGGQASGFQRVRRAAVAASSPRRRRRGGIWAGARWSAERENVRATRTLPKPTTDRSCGMCRPCCRRVLAQPMATRSLTAWTAVASHFSLANCSAAFAPSSMVLPAWKTRRSSTSTPGFAQARGDSLRIVPAPTARQRPGEIGDAFDGPAASRCCVAA